MGTIPSMSDNDKKTITGEVKRGLEDAKDSAGEAMHRSAAEAEKTRREVDGDNMSLRDKVTSGASEAKHRIEAETDKAKRHARDST